MLTFAGRKTQGKRKNIIQALKDLREVSNNAAAGKTLLGNG